VDLVMLRRNRLVGVEVKSSSTVKREDFAGLSQLAKDRRFFRGYLVYTGSRVLKYPNGLWALPVSALWEPGAFV
jgi:predicted AAA+ superfamily ATPase